MGSSVSTVLLLLALLLLINFVGTDDPLFFVPLVSYDTPGSDSCQKDVRFTETPTVGVRDVVAFSAARRLP